MDASNIAAVQSAMQFIKSQMLDPLFKNLKLFGLKVKDDNLIDFAILIYGWKTNHLKSELNFENFDICWENEKGIYNLIVGVVIDVTRYSITKWDETIVYYEIWLLE